MLLGQRRPGARASPGSISRPIGRSPESPWPERYGAGAGLGIPWPIGNLPPRRLAKGSLNPGRPPIGTPIPIAGPRSGRGHPPRMADRGSLPP
jgi:hypothetical protein